MHGCPQLCPPGMLSTKRRKYGGVYGANPSQNARSRAYGAA